MASQLSDIHDSLKGKLSGLFALGQPRRINQIQESERTEVFQWMSNVPYRGHHRSKKKDYLAGSCKWLLEKEKFVEWRKSSVSSILWLHGIRELCPNRPQPGYS